MTRPRSNIERSITDLEQLSLDEEGRYFAESLKLKHWSAVLINSFTGILQDRSNQPRKCLQIVCK
jgi:hypothetical protein